MELTSILDFSTALLPPKDRLPFLIDEFGRQLRKIDWTPADGADPLAVHASCRFVSLPQAKIADVTWSSGAVVVAAASETDDALLVYRERQRTAWFETANGTSYRTVPGSLVLHPSDIVFSRGGIAPEHDYDFQVVTLPMAKLSAFGKPDYLRRISHLDPRDPYNALLSSYFSDWCRTMPDLTPEQGDVATRTLINLLAVAGGVFDSRETEATQAVAAARIRAAERFIEANLNRPNLSPQLVANHLGISVRQLHLDFEPTGRSVARRILAGRIELARRLLLEQPNLSVTEIAFSAGFEGLSTFYRAFKAATGGTAREYREEVAGTMANPQQDS